MGILFNLAVYFTGGPLFKKMCLILIAAGSLAGCAANPHDLRVTEANKDTFMSDIKSEKGLTVEEVGLLVGFQMRAALSAKLGDGSVTAVGKTVGELIESERKLQAEAKAKEEEADRLAKEAKAKADAAMAQMRNAINLTVFDKTFIPSDIHASRFNDYIIIKCAYENKSGKDIRAFRGGVQFTDLFGKEIFSTNLTIQDPIAANAKANWNGQIEYNQFRSEHQQLRNADLSNMKVVWLPAEVLFADGTTLSAEVK